MVREFPPSILVLLVMVLSLHTTVDAECLDPEITLMAGKSDGFTLPTETVRPSRELLSYVKSSWPQTGTRQFDRAGVNNALIHTFSGWAGAVCGASLEIGLLAQSDPLVDNDSIRL